MSSLLRDLLAFFLAALWQCGCVNKATTFEGISNARINVLEAVGSKMDATTPPRDDYCDVLSLGQLHQVQHLTSSPIFAIFVIVFYGEVAGDSIRQHVVACSNEFSVVQQQRQEGAYVCNARNGACMALKYALAIDDCPPMKDQWCQLVFSVAVADCLGCPRAWALRVRVGVEVEARCNGSLSLWTTLNGRNWISMFQSFLR